MEIFGGFMMMLSIIGFFLVVIWFLLPLVIFNIKGKVDRAVFMLEEMDQRLKAMERNLLECRTVVVEESEKPLTPPL